MPCARVEGNLVSLCKPPVKRMRVKVMRLRCADTELCACAPPVRPCRVGGASPLRPTAIYTRTPCHPSSHPRILCRANVCVAARNPETAAYRQHAVMLLHRFVLLCLSTVCSGTKLRDVTERHGQGKRS
ncbi:hypothetical protein J6590_023275 [Homalodisca vitripennis]|nr:hypothetical protein J6590_023275 [Homalodisca vitripennis]